MKAFATVGTTEFEDLIGVLGSESIQSVLVARGFATLQVQKGKGKQLVQSCVPGLTVENYDFKPSLINDMTSSDLILSHAGAGSVLESSRLGKVVVVVVNETLMDNHQNELADAMANLKYVYKCTVRSLQEVSGCSHPYNATDTGKSRLRRPEKISQRGLFWFWSNGE